MHCLDINWMHLSSTLYMGRPITRSQLHDEYPSLHIIGCKETHGGFGSAGSTHLSQIWATATPTNAFKPLICLITGHRNHHLIIVSRSEMGWVGALNQGKCYLYCTHTVSHLTILHFADHRLRIYLNCSDFLKFFTQIPSLSKQVAFSNHDFHNFDQITACHQVD